MKSNKNRCSRLAGRLSLPFAIGAAILLPGMDVRADQVILDDLVVTGSECIGFDCVDGENFGFDTLRLKENNTQINFDDTSATAGFPNNDWRIIANDSASGGASYLAIEDSTAGRQVFRVDAGAPASALIVDSQGEVGLGTPTPVANLHMVDGNTPTVRLEQNGSAGFSPQTWDVAGNEANFFVRDVTNGSTLPFKIIPGAPNNAVYVASSGNVGLGTTSPAAKLHVSGGNVVVEQPTAVSADLALSRTSGNSWVVRNNADTGRLTFSVDSGGVTNVPVKIAAEAVTNILRIGVTDPNTVDVRGTLRVLGALTVNGTNVPDYVFDPAYELPSIEQQAAAMFDQRHLPAVPPAPRGGDGEIDIVAYQLGMLEELEKAHVYISLLNQQLHTLREDLDSKDRALARLEARLEAVEAR